MGSCKYCRKEFVGRALGGHMTNCHANPSREKTVAKIAAKLRGRELSEAHREAVSKTCKIRSETGTWHNSFARSRTHEYKGIKLHGMWEVKYARHLDSMGIKWRRPSESFPYLLDGRERRYTPDFYIIDSDEYIEIKGYTTPKDRAKWEQFPKKLTVLTGKELKSMGIIDEYRELT